MELHLQFGYGMMEHCRHLISKWGGGTVVLSPRDMNDKQMRNLSAQITEIQGGCVLIDPQFYLPHADHERLCSHDYWPSDYKTGAFFQGTQLKALIEDLVKLNSSVGSNELILPGLLAASINDDWLEIQRIVVEKAQELVNKKPVIATIALSAEAAKSNDQIAILIDIAPRWGADGFYIVCEHPNGNYIVQDPIWIANVLDLVAGLSLTGAKVILGYCNHQMLIAGAVNVDAICSGTWMNVRSFPPEKFHIAYQEEIRQRARWYYCPQALSEYKLPFLDVALRQGLLMSMSPSAELDGGYAGRLFEGPQPTTVDFPEQVAFRHYLHCLHGQAKALEHDGYDEAVEMQHSLLDEAETILSTLNNAGVRGQQRDFSEAIDVNRAALSILHDTRGPILRRKWQSMGYNNH